MKEILVNLFVLIVTLCQWNLINGHGRMIEPAARNAMWRYDYKNPRNYNDMGLNCGGFTNQFERQGGRCGVCGDPWQGPRDHEAGGKYARGVVARQYRVSSLINVTVELTSNHMGYFEFRLCPVNDPRKPATQACLDRHLLNIAGHGQRYFITRQGANVFEELAVMLPRGLLCSQCVLQWKWVAGQSMGPDGYGGECLGCGNQENFINCADIAIGNDVVAPLPLLPVDATPPTPQPAPAGPSYDTYNTAGNKAGNQPDMAAVKQIVSKLMHRANTLHKTIRPKSSWNEPSYNKAPAPQPRPLTPPPAPQWNTVAPPTSTPMWKAPPTPSPANIWQQAGSFDWFGGISNSFQPTPTNEYSHSQYEPGEYPEPGEGPISGGASHGSGGYMQGYNDAMRQLKESFGMNSGMAEVNVHLQESRKQNVPNYNQGSTPQTCPDGSEPECRAVNPAQSSLFDSFCSNACGVGQCPNELCTCSCSGSGGWGYENMGAMMGHCRALDRTKGASMDTWCTQNCQRGNCPSEICVCG
ncbi:hypothetical protein ACF0H5_013265 [Mactra antiquata]